MKSFACYCQKCRAANQPGEELCANCGTPLMLVVVPPSAKNESLWSDNFPQEHLLERISLLELRLMQITDRLSQALDLMLRQSRTVQNEHLLVETLIDALTNSGVIESGSVSQLWQEKKKKEEQQLIAELRREQIQENILSAASGKRYEIFVHLIKEAFRLIQNGDEKQGIRTLERAAAVETKNFPLLLFIGEHYFRQDKRTLARDYLEKAHKTVVEDQRAALPLAVILANEGETEQAKTLLEAINAEKSFAANFILGVIYAAEKRFDQTLAAFKRALAAKPNAETHYLVGSAYAELNREKVALRHLQKAVELDANFADAWFMLGAIYLRLGDETNAKTALASSLAARDSAAQSHAVLRNPKKHVDIARTTLLFARLSHLQKNLINSLPPRLTKLLHEEILK